MLEQILIGSEYFIPVPKTSAPLHSVLFLILARSNYTNITMCLQPIPLRHIYWKANFLVAPQF